MPKNTITSADIDRWLNSKKNQGLSTTKEKTEEELEYDSRVILIMTMSNVIKQKLSPKMQADWKKFEGAVLGNGGNISKENLDNFEQVICLLSSYMVAEKEGLNDESNLYNRFKAYLERGACRDKAKVLDMVSYFEPSVDDVCKRLKAERLDLNSKPDKGLLKDIAFENIYANLRGTDKLDIWKKIEANTDNVPIKNQNRLASVLTTCQEFRGNNDVIKSVISTIPEGPRETTMGLAALIAPELQQFQADTVTQDSGRTI